MKGEKNNKIYFIAIMACITLLLCHTIFDIRCIVINLSHVLGIVTVYDVTRRDTFTNLSEVWSKEIDLYSTNQDCIRMLVGNKVDKVIFRQCCPSLILWQI